MTSIRHFPATHPLPDWRNFGVMLRVLLGVNGLAGLAALVQAGDIGKWLETYLQLAAVVEPLLLIELGLLSLLRDMLWRLPLRLGQACVAVLAGGLAAAMFLYARSLLPIDTGATLRAVLLAVASAVLLLAYFELRSRALSPAQAEARLAALNARIRPHFLFNTLNTAIALVRVDPARAEAVLEDLAELFRVALEGEQAGATLAQEVELARRYLDIEQIRFGQRLRIEWDLDPACSPAKLPPLLLQPLVENAVKHGIEPGANGGKLRGRTREHRGIAHVEGIKS